MINRVVLVGRLTKDPELKYTQSGVAVTRFTFAVNRAFLTNKVKKKPILSVVSLGENKLKTLQTF